LSNRNIKHKLKHTKGKITRYTDQNLQGWIAVTCLRIMMNYEKWIKV
jgi:hypothetical protein